MSNLTAARETLEKNKNLEAIINPQPKKRIRLPLQRDINLIQGILDEKIDAKEKDVKDKLLNTAKIKWATKISAIHSIAISLRQEIEQLVKAIELESNNQITADLNDSSSYTSDYWGKLPKSVAEAEEEEFLELKESKIPEIEKLKEEVNEYVLNIKIGLAPLSDVKLLLDRIEQLS